MVLRPHQAFGEQKGSIQGLSSELAARVPPAMLDGQLATGWCVRINGPSLTLRSRLRWESNSSVLKGECSVEREQERRKQLPSTLKNKGTSWSAQAREREMEQPASDCVPVRAVLQCRRRAKHFPSSREDSCRQPGPFGTGLTAVMGRREDKPNPPDRTAKLRA